MELAIAEAARGSSGIAEVNSPSMFPPTDITASDLAIVIVAAGAGRRFGGDKLSAMIGEKTVLETSVERLHGALPGVPIVVVVAMAEVERWRSKLAVDEVVAGGPRRQDSVKIGIDQAVAAGATIAVVHDGARPLVHSDDVARVIDSRGNADAAILVLAVTDTVKEVDGYGLVTRTLDRDRLRMAQTPQVFRVSALEAAWRRQDWSREWSDEAALLEADGCEVRTVPAEHPNPKLTTVSDLRLARLLIGDES